MAKHVHRCTRTVPLHTPCRCRCGAERVTPDACGAEVPREGGRWTKVVAETANPLRPLAEDTNERRGVKDL